MGRFFSERRRSREPYEYQDARAKSAIQRQALVAPETTWRTGLVSALGTGPWRASANRSTHRVQTKNPKMV